MTVDASRGGPGRAFAPAGTPTEDR